MHIETTSNSAGASKKSKSLLSKRRKRKGMNFNLNLTPMVDMFSLLVIFLLQFFSSSPEFLLTPGLSLPKSDTVKEPKRFAIISVTEKEVFVEKKPMGTIDDVLKNPDPMIKELDRISAMLKAKQSAKASPQDVESLGSSISLEAHESIKSTVISQFMAILSAYHYGNIDLMALSAKT